MRTIKRLKITSIQISPNYILFRRRTGVARHSRYLMNDLPSRRLLRLCIVFQSNFNPFSFYRLLDESVMFVGN